MIYIERTCNKISGHPLMIVASQFGQLIAASYVQCLENNSLISGYHLMTVASKFRQLIAETYAHSSETNRYLKQFINKLYVCQIHVKSIELKLLTQMKKLYISLVKEWIKITSIEPWDVEWALQISILGVVRNARIRVLERSIK